VDLTHPATDLHIKKAEEQPYHMVRESEIRTTKPHGKRESSKSNQATWEERVK
jgi:hypothetical protein